jgi:hypothetical protein
MEISITYKASTQISPDDFAVYTKVIRISEDETIKEIVDKHFKNCNEIGVNLFIKK